VSATPPDSAAALAEVVERFVFGLVRSQAAQEANLLTSTQTVALAEVADFGPLRLGALAGRVSTTDATATRTVDALEAYGLARRTQDPADRRAAFVTATEAGRRGVARRRAQLVETLEQALREVDPRDARCFFGLLEQLERRVAPHHHRDSR